MLLIIERNVAGGDGLLSQRVDILRRVCHPDSNGERLLAAGRLSVQMRRLMLALPPSCKIYNLYRAWTMQVAKCLSIVEPSMLMHLCPQDPSYPCLSRVNRLYVCGVSHALLQHCSIFDTTRPAYLPNSSTFASWCAEAHEAHSSERLQRHAEQVAQHTVDFNAKMAKYILRGKFRETFADFNVGCLGAIQEALL